MNIITIFIGLLPIAYSLYILFLRLGGKDEKFRKLSPMQERFGNRAGSIIHYVGYVVMPFLAGLIIVVSGIKGLSIMDLISL